MNTSFHKCLIEWYSDYEELKISQENLSYADYCKLRMEYER